MGFTSGVALSGTVLSAAVCASYPSVMGVSVLLLVSARLGDRDLCSAGHRVFQTEDLTVEGAHLLLTAKACDEIKTTRQHNADALRISL